MSSSIAFDGISTNRSDTAEFCRLLYFFQKLQEPRPRVLARRTHREPVVEVDEDSSDDETGSAAIPRDLAPLVENLATILEGKPTTTNNTSLLRPRPSAPARPRSKTIAASPPRTTPISKKGSSFGGKNFQFTFKMLLHKLYNAEDWANKVGALLADSQARFRPLTDAPPTPPPATSTFPTHNTPRRRAISQSRGGKYGAIGIGLGRPTQMSVEPDKANGAARTTEPALKRRIVNRRRSSADPEGKMSVPSSGWVYEAEVSARQVGPQESIRRRKRVVSSVAYSEEQKEARRASGDISPMLYGGQFVSKFGVHFHTPRAFLTSTLRAFLHNYTRAFLTAHTATSQLYSPLGEARLPRVAGPSLLPSRPSRERRCKALKISSPTMPIKW
ncbi:unnamed protein product [Peniophora sp. CBMAI 1063]|nr:unnamed protein product [Peniophora sp. CBMAI 1063]